MPVKKNASGQRSVQAEAEVPGTPEGVWRAIASGPGISSWFVPTELDERVGGATVSHFSPDGSMDSTATITTWDPPHTFIAESDEGGLAVATEWHVEARSGGTCVVRVVHRWFASSDDWDAQFEGHTYGWLAFFRVLRLYLSQFPGETGAMLQVMGAAPGPKSAAWEAFSGGLGLAGGAIGDRFRAPADAPPLSGQIEGIGQPDFPEALLLLEEPTPGIAHLAAHEMNDQVYLWLRAYLFGAGAAAAVARVEPVWQAWLNERFPMGVAAGTAD
jgi:uncharacterized protein YndB with AHSA1/START domain